MGDNSDATYVYYPSPTSMASKPNHVSLDSIIIALVVLFFVLAFCFFLSLYIRWYWSRTEDPSVVSWRRRAARQVTPAAQAVTRRRGLDRVTLRTLPLVVYDPKEFKEGLECSVCLSEISLGEKVRLLPKCNHGFHVECIDMWFKSHSTCPLCRNLVSSSPKQSNDSVQESEEVDVTRVISDTDSDSDSDSNSDSDSDHEGGSHASVAISYPTNVLYWGDEVQVRSLGEATNNNVATSTSTSSSSNNNGVNGQRDELVIEIPSDLCHECFSSPLSSAEFREEEAKTPVMSRLRSLKRLLSRGKSLAPWASSSSSSNVEQV
ncbi:RING-H2 finger protein ATL60-like [Silene latifolia]|uniref:RING-H2 finger protein ATL60-like n=1 Tax=Silene latifolia TaxID=37657 RepID=UPI003D7743B0